VVSTTARDHSPTRRGRGLQCGPERGRDGGVDQHEGVLDPVHEGVGHVGLVVGDVQLLPEDQDRPIVDLDQVTERGHGIPPELAET
jgi:hypothetical protein